MAKITHNVAPTDGQSHTSEPENAPTKPQNPNAAAIEAARKRVSEREAREREERLERSRQADSWGNPYSAWNFFLEVIGGRLLVFLIIGGLWLLISGVMWLAGALPEPMYMLVRALDTVTGAAAMPLFPFVMWAFWGAVFGGALGYWLLAPVYGNRENRAFILYFPLLAMVIIAALLWVFL